MIYEYIWRQVKKQQLQLQERTGSWTRVIFLSLLQWQRSKPRQLGGEISYYICIHLSPSLWIRRLARLINFYLAEWRGICIQHKIKSIICTKLFNNKLAMRWWKVSKLLSVKLTIENKNRYTKSISESKLLIKLLNVLEACNCWDYLKLIK